MKAPPIRPVQTAIVKAMMTALRDPLEGARMVADVITATIPMSHVTTMTTATTKGKARGKQESEAPTHTRGYRSRTAGRLDACWP